MGRSWMESIGDADGRSKRNSKISKTGSIEGGGEGEGGRQPDWMEIPLPGRVKIVQMNWKLLHSV